MVWAKHQVEHLWNGRRNEVVMALHCLHLSCLAFPEDVGRSPAYFENRLSKIDYARFRQEGYPNGSGLWKARATRWSIIA